MADRRPLVLISGVFSELPAGDTAIGASAGTLTAGSGVAGGGALDGSARRLDIALAPNASGLIIVGTGDTATLGFDGSHVASGSAACAYPMGAYLCCHLGSLAHVSLAHLPSA